VRNLVPARALQRRSRNLLYAAALVALVGVVMALIGVALFVIPLVVPSNTAFPLYDGLRRLLVALGIFIVLIGLLLIIRALTWKQDNTLAEMVGQTLAAFLDDRYGFIRNVSKLSLGYIDGVLLGPPGVLVMRIVDRDGILFNDGAGWLEQVDKGDWKTLRWNPTQETVADVKKMREFLKTRGLGDTPVFGVIVFTKEMPAAQFTTRNPLVQAVYLSKFDYELKPTYFAKDRLDQTTVNRLVTFLYG
jgi:hypothetical protein